MKYLTFNQMFKLCNKNEFAAKCLFYYFKVFGGIPITLDITFLKSNGNRIWMFSASRVGIIYNIFLFILILVTNSISIISQYSSDFINRIVFERVTDALADGFTLFTSLSIVATFLIQHDRFLSLINRLSKANRLLITIDRTTYNEQNKLPSTLSKIFVLNTLIWLIMIFSWPANDITVTLNFFSSYMVINIIDSLVLQYAAILKLLQHLFKVVNENLSSFARESKWHLHRGSRIDRLMRLRKSHMSLSKLAQDLSDFYSAPILLCVTDTFIVLTLIGYYFIKPLVIGKNELPLPMFFHVLGYGLVFAMQLVVLTKCVGATIAESERTGPMINACLENCLNNAECQEIQQRLNLFSNYLLHKKINFTVYRLFSLDESLLMSIMGSITTYLVIFLQFQKDD